MIKRPAISVLIPELFTADSLHKNLSRWSVMRWRVASNSSSLADFCSCKIARAESISFLIRYNTNTYANAFCQHIRYYVIFLTICDRICEKGPLRGNVNIWVRDKTRAKPPIHTIADYCIIGRYCVSPIFRPSLKPVRLSCVSNEDWIVSLRRSLWPCTE